MPGRNIVLCAAVTTAAVLGSGCMSVEDMAERTAYAEAGILKERESFFKNDYARYYRYFPEAQVYHSAFHDRYYWLDDQNEWKSSTFLPEHIELGQEEPVMLELYTSRPYTQHEDVLVKHPASSSDTPGAYASVDTQ